MRYAAVVVLISILAGVIYSASWLHGNPIAEEGGWKNVSLDERVVEVNVSTLSFHINDWRGLHTFKSCYFGGDVTACIVADVLGMRNTAGTQVRISAPTRVSVSPRDSSVRILRVELKVVTANNTWFDDMVPEDFTGYPVFKAVEGPFRVEVEWCGDPNRAGCTVVTPDEPAWGSRLVFRAWPDFTVNGEPPSYAGRVEVHLIVEYEVRDGFFTAKKRGVEMEIPLEINLYDVPSGTT